MKGVSLNLVVLKSRSIEKMLAFYGALGIEFRQEQHGNGPVHQAGKLGELVLEIYPGADSVARLGFAVDNLDGTLVALQAIGTPIVLPAKSTEWGWRAVVSDPDGRAVELYQR